MQGVTAWGERGGYPPGSFPPLPYHFKEILCTSIFMDKNSTVTDIYFFTLSLTRQVVPKSILSTSEKHRSKFKSTHVLLARAHRKIHKPNYKMRKVNPKTHQNSPQNT